MHQSRRERSSYAYIQCPLPLFLDIDGSGPPDARAFRLRARHCVNYDGLSPDTGLFRVSLVDLICRVQFFTGIGSSGATLRHQMDRSDIQIPSKVSGTGPCVLLDRFPQQGYQNNRNHG